MKEDRNAEVVAIGYGDQEGYDRTDASVRQEAHEHDARLVSAGAEMWIADTPVHVRNHNGAGMAVENGPFSSSALPVAGFAVIEAESVEEAAELVSQTPCAVAHGVVEVWPLRTS